MVCWNNSRHKKNKLVLVVFLVHYSLREMKICLKLFVLVKDSQCLMCLRLVCSLISNTYFGHTHVMLHASVFFAGHSFNEGDAPVAPPQVPSHQQQQQQQHHHDQYPHSWAAQQQQQQQQHFHILNYLVPKTVEK